MDLQPVPATRLFPWNEALAAPILEGPRSARWAGVLHDEHRGARLASRPFDELQSNLDRTTSSFVPIAATPFLERSTRALTHEVFSS